ncbi:MAG TPA: hypothetical protein VNJ51_05010 [Candidatus Dormibacteraeota bacterium]|nr:hypothetical protein [Candidatus Dormibacteraeota bacterium]
MRSEARAASEGDVERAALLLHAAAPGRSREAYETALRARITESDGGTLIAGESTLSWALDGGALFLYDLAGDRDGVESLVALAERIAHRCLAVVLAATLFDDDPMLEHLSALGFAHDWSEAEASGGRVRKLVGLVHPVGEDG